MPAELASQTLTFLFTDIEGSTRLWEQHRQLMKEALERHDGIVRKAVENWNGQVVKTTGDGLMAVFGSASDGVSACLEAHQTLMQIDQKNVERFKEVTQFMAEDLKKLKVAGR